MPPVGYHHGQLRAALVDNALDILRTEGLPKLSLRAAARRAGVSQTAPYHHFSDKRALLAAVAETGFRRFHAATRAAARDAPDSAEYLARLGCGYVQFALDEPALFRLMFGPELVPFSDFTHLKGAADASYEELRSAVMAVKGGPHAADSGDAVVAATAAWAQVHGLAVLLLDRRIGVAPGDEPRLVRQIMDQVAGRHS